MGFTNETQYVIREYLKANRFKGFDELTEDLQARYGDNITKDFVKRMWNDARLGFKYIPRTLTTIEPRTISRMRRFLFWTWWKNKREYILEDDLIVFIDPVTPRVIPKGFRTDMGSVPTWARFVADKDDPRFLFAFFNHDLDYVLRWTSRRIADARLLFYAKQAGAPFIQRWIVYLGVRVGGFFSWRNNSDMKTSERNQTINLVNEATMRYREKKNGDLLQVAKRYSL